MNPVPIADYLRQRGSDPGGAAAARIISAFALDKDIVRASVTSIAPIQAYAQASRQEASANAHRRDFAPQPQPPILPDDVCESQIAKSIDARVQDAFARGRQEGMDAAREEFALKRDAEIEESRLAADRQCRQMRQDEMAGIATALSSSLLEIETRISASIGRILAPIVAASIVQTMLEEFSQAMATMRLGVSDPPIVIRGQPHLLAALRRKIVELGLNVELIDDDAVELFLEVGETSIESSLRDWLSGISEIAD